MGLNKLNDIPLENLDFEVKKNFLQVNKCLRKINPNIDIKIEEICNKETGFDVYCRPKDFVKFLYAITGDIKFTKECYYPKLCGNRIVYRDKKIPETVEFRASYGNVRTLKNYKVHMLYLKPESFYIDNEKYTLISIIVLEKENVSTGFYFIVKEDIIEIPKTFWLRLEYETKALPNELP